MATRIETLGTGRQAPRSAWLMLVAIVLIAVALAIGALVGSSGGTTAPARTANEGAAVVAPAGAVPGLIKGGLQPRPYSPIVVDEPAVGVATRSRAVLEPSPSRALPCTAGRLPSARLPRLAAGGTAARGWKPPNTRIRGRLR